MNRNRARPAFTMIELIVVIVVMGILTSVLMNYWPQHTTSLLSVSELLVQDLRYVKAYSMTHHAPYRIVFTQLSPFTYKMESLDGSLELPNLNGEGNNMVVFDGVSVVLTGLPGSMIVFDQKGRPSIDENLNPLTAQADLELVTEESAVHIGVEPLTGFSFIK